jgi:hypothetical protein
MEGGVNTSETGDDDVVADEVSACGERYDERRRAGRDRRHTKDIHGRHATAASRRDMGEVGWCRFGRDQPDG